MKIKILKLLICTLFFLSFKTKADTYSILHKPDLALTGPRSKSGPTLAKSSEPSPYFSIIRQVLEIRSAGLGGAGVALADGIFAAQCNPALLSQYHLFMRNKYCVQFAYQTDSLFSRYIVGSGASWLSNATTAIGTWNRILSRGNRDQVQEYAFSSSGLLFPERDDLSPVFIGINMRYQSSQWRSQPLDSLCIYKKVFSPNGNLILDSLANKYLPTGITSLLENEKKVLFDIGFFQRNVLANIDFGLVFSNCIGYSWLKTSPSVYDTLIPIIPSSNNTFVDSAYYVNETISNTKWESGICKRLIVGIAYSTGFARNKLFLRIPADVEYFGLFSPDQATFALHTGAEITISNRLFLRIGYSSEPPDIKDYPFTWGKMTGRISMGAGVRLNQGVVDFFVKNGYWGIGLAYAF